MMALRGVLSPVSRALLAPGCSAALLRFGQQVNTASSVAAVEIHEEFRDTSRVGKQGWGQTKVHDVLTAKKEDQGAWLWCSKDDYVIDAVRKMTRGNVGSLLVFDPSKINLSPAEATSMKAAQEDAVVGIVTERDYLTKIVVVGKNSASTRVTEIMTPQSKMMTITPHHSIIDAMTLMMKNNFRHVPVVEEGVYMGMVSIRDTVNVMVQEHKEEVGRLQEYIQGSY